MGVKLKGLQERLDRIPEHVKQMVRMKNSYEEKVWALNELIEAQANYIDSLVAVVSPLKIYANHFGYLHKEEDLRDLQNTKQQWREAKEKYKDFLTKKLFGN